MDDVKNVKRYILRYTVENSKLLRNVAFHWLASGFTSLGITVLKIVILGDSKSSVLWPQISDHKTDDLPPQMTILKTVTP